MKFLKKRLALISILFTSFVLSLMSHVRGLYSWDHFTLWGTHPKLIWATGNYATSGLDVPNKFKYQSVWGSLTGILAHIINPTHYFDGLWIISNIFIILALCFLVVLTDKNKWTTSSIIVFIFAFVPGTIMGQQIWGGYVDLAAVLFICLGFKCFLRNNLKLAFVFFIGCLFTKINFWPWIFILGACLTITNFSLQNIKKFFLCFLMPIILGVGLLAIIYPKENSADAVKYWSLMFRMESFGYIAGLYLKVFTSINAVLLLTLIWAIYKKDKFVLLYLVSGMAYITLAYLLLLKPTSSEDYPSIKRYVFPLVFPLMFYVLERIKIVKPMRLALIGLAFSLIRVGESYDHIKSFRLSYLSNYCNFSTIVCERKDLIVNSEWGSTKEIVVSKDDISKLGIPDDINPSAIFFVGLPERLIFIR